MDLTELIEKNLEKIKTLQQDAFKRISTAQDQAQQGINTAENIPSYWESVNNIKARLIGTLKLVKSFDKGEPDYNLLPYAYLQGLNVALSKIASELERIIGGFSQLESNGGIGTINNSNYVILSQNGQFSFELQPLLTSVDTHIDTALDHFYKISFVLKRADYSGLSDVVGEFAGTLNEISNKRNEVGALLKATIEAKNKTEKAGAGTLGQLDAATNIVKQIADIKSDADNKLQQVNEIQAKSIQQAPVIEQVYQKATALKQDVEAYQKQFIQFQEELEGRIKKYNEGNESLETLIKAFHKQSEEIDRINREATAALNFSTVAGLAKGFGDKKDDLSAEQSKAYDSFKGSLWLFFLSSLIPIAYLFMKIVDGKEIKFEELSMTLLPVIPAVIFTKFSASRHNNLFRLREHYAHKYSVSFSLKGFKDELEDGKQKDLVEATFKDLATHNPAEKIDNNDGGDKHPLPFWDTIASYISPK